jgi:NAD-dependent DNA ligase
VASKGHISRLVAALADGKVDSEEEREILDLLLAAVGGKTAPQVGEASEQHLASALQLALQSCAGQSFCFTGKFNSGTRDWCQESVESRGGVLAGTVTKKLSYLVIGGLGSRDWLHSTHGTKILKAIEYRDRGTPLAMVSEQHWFEQLS